MKRRKLRYFHQKKEKEIKCLIFFIFQKKTIAERQVFKKKDNDLILLKI